MERNFVIHSREKGTMILSETECIKNALEQEKAGVRPSYAWRDKESTLSPGWLVWSTWEDGAGVVVRRSDGKMYVQTGWQGDFAVV